MKILAKLFILTIEYSLRFQQNLSLISVITSVINSTSKRHPVSFDNIFKLISSSNIKSDEIFWTEANFIKPFLMGLYHPLDGVTNLKYKLMHFLTPIKKNSKRKALAFNRDRCCHLALCLWLILFHSTYLLGYNLFC